MSLRDIFPALWGATLVRGTFIILVFSSIKEKNDGARNDNTAAVWLKPADLISFLKKKGSEAYIF